MGRSKTGSLVLDIDGTLIDSIPNGHLSGVGRTPDCISEWGDYIYFRPHLESFLLYAFSRFEHVAIWTAASPEWAETIMLAFQPMLRRVKRQLNRKRSGSMECDCGAAARRTAMFKGATEEQRGEACDCTLPPTKTDDMFAFVYTKAKCSKKCVPDYDSQLLYEYHTKPLRKVWRNKSFQKLGWNPKKTLILEDTPQNCVSNYGNALYIRTFDVTDTRRKDSALLVLQAFLDRIRHVDDVRTVEKRDWERLCASAVKQSHFPAPLKHALSAPGHIGFNFRQAEPQASSSRPTASSSSAFTMPTPQTHTFETSTQSSFIEEEEDRKLVSLSCATSATHSHALPASRPRLSELASTFMQGKPAPMAKHATTGNLFATVLTKHHSQSRPTTYHARYQEEEVASDSDPEQDSHFRFENDCYSSSEQFSDDDLSSSSSESEGDLSSSDEETIEDRMYFKGMHRSTSLPMTSYCHRMPKMLDFARLKISIVAEPVQGRGKSDVDAIEV